MRNIKHILFLTTLLLLFPSLKVFASESAAYEIQWEYSVTNISDEAVREVSFGFDPGYYALESSCQPDTNVSLNMTTLFNEPLQNYGFIKLYKTNLQAGETQNITMTWTFKCGDFDQRLYTSALQKPVSAEPFFGNNELIELTSKLTEGLSGNRAKAFAIYTWITQNIKYGEEQTYTQPETANCETYAFLFNSMCRIAEIPCRDVYGYVIRLTDSDGELTYGTADITEQNMHVWNEFYDEISGWVTADSTLDAGKSEFEFFMQGNEQNPHLAMFYDKLPTLMTSTDSGDCERTIWSKKITLTRSEFTENYSNDENALAVYKRTKTESETIEEFFATQGIFVKINRLTDGLSWNGNVLNIPAKYHVSTRKSNILEISYDRQLLLQCQIIKDGSWRLLYMPN